MVSSHAPTAEMLRQQDQIIRSDEDRQRQLERQHKEMLGRQQSNLEGQQQNATGAEADDSVCVQVKAITLNGATLLSASEKTALTKPYAGQCLSMRRIEQLIRDITNHYIAKGYSTTRAYLEPQDISTGTLVIKVIEGSIEGIRLNEDTPADRWRVRTAFPGLVGEPLNLRDIEQGLDQLNRLPSSDAKMEIVPGEQPGTSRIVITDKQAKSWRVRANLDNSGQKSTGTDQYTLSLDKDGLLGLNDLLTFNYSADADSLASFERHQSESSTFYYSVPLGYWTFTGSASFFDYHTFLAGGGVDYRSTGNTTTYTLDATRVLHRDADGKTSGGVSFITKKINNFLEGERLKTSSYDLSILKTSLDHSQRILGGLFNVTGEYHLGLPVLDAPQDKTSQLVTPKHEYYKLVLSGGYTRPFSVLEHDLTFSTQGQLQWTPDTLYNSERLNLGSRYTVRGFQHDSLTGDSGGYIRNELAASILPAKERPEWVTKTLGNPQIYVGYDAGFIHRDETDAYERGTLQGAAAGLRASSEHFSTDLCLSHPLDAPSFMKNRDWEFYWMFSFKI
jgi:hemolysin activation/secretion protein